MNLMHPNAQALPSFVFLAGLMATVTNIKVAK
jgi:hypothetical protein